MRSFNLLALALLVNANPVPTPPPSHPTSLFSRPPLSPPTKPSCTTTLTSLLTGFQGDFIPEIAQTIYTKTHTATAHVNCHGCLLAQTTELAHPWGGIGPQEIITATVTAREATTTTTTVCARPTQPHHGELPRAIPAPIPSCTFTRLIPLTPLPVTDGVQTVHTTTATTTSHVDCQGCNHIAVSTVDYLNPGPRVFFTATTTVKKPATATEYVCLRSPSVVTPGTGRTLPVEPTVVVERVAGTTPPAHPGKPTNPTASTTTIKLPGRK